MVLSLSAELAFSTGIHDSPQPPTAYNFSYFSFFYWLLCCFYQTYIIIIYWYIGTQYHIRTATHYCVGVWKGVAPLFCYLHSSTQLPLTNKVRILNILDVILLYYYYYSLIETFVHYIHIENKTLLIISNMIYLNLPKIKYESFTKQFLVAAVY